MRPLFIRDPYNLGALGQEPATVKALKDYFDVATYRNVLDMLTQLEDQTKKLGKELANSARQLRGIKTRKGAIGYAIKRVGNIGGTNGDQAGFKYTNVLLKAAKLPTWNFLSPSSHYYFRYFDISPKKYGFNKSEFEDIARLLRFEMNRIRLPLPDNFPQIVNLIKSRNFDINFKRGNVPSDAQIINYWEVLKNYPALWESLQRMMASVRNELEARALAEKVQEQTIRIETEKVKEQAALEKQAAAKKLALEKEREKRIEEQQNIIAEQQQKLAENKTTVEALKVEGTPEALEQANQLEQRLAQIESTVNNRLNLLQNAAAQNTEQQVQAANQMKKANDKKEAVTPAQTGLQKAAAPILLTLLATQVF